MIPAEDSAYFARRAARHQLLARHATDQTAQLAHEQLCGLYAAKCDDDGLMPKAPRTP